MKRAREQRGAMLAGWPNGYGNSDPSAIPPPGMYNQQRAGVPVTPHTVLQLGVVHRCLEVIVNSVLQMGNPRAFRWVNDKDNQPYRAYLGAAQPAVLSNTWGNLTQSEGTTRSLISMALFGETFWYTLTRDFYQFPSSLEVINPMFMTVNEDESHNPVYFYGAGVNRVQLESENITHIQGLTMPGARRSLSAIEYESPSFALALAAVEYGSRWFAQGASPSFLLSTEMKLNKDEVKRIAETFLTEHSGLQASHLPLVLDSGMKAQKISSTPDEAQFLGTLEYIRQEIAGFFGIPPHLIGSTGDSGGTWGKGVEEGNYSMIDFTLSGYTTRLEEAYTSLIPRGQFASLDESNLFRANAADRAKEITAIRLNTVKTINEIRRDTYGYPPVPGGDVLDAPLASNLAPANSSAIGADATKPNDTDLDDESDPDSGEK